VYWLSRIELIAQLIGSVLKVAHRHSHIAFTSRLIVAIAIESLCQARTEAVAARFNASN
jgi:hypothetical protein